MTPATSRGLEAEQPRDAVVLVDDVVAGAQVGEARERAPERGRRARPPAAEDLRVGEQREPELAPDEAAPRRADRERDPGSATSPGGEQRRLDPAQQVPLALGLAAMGEGDDDVEPLAPRSRGARSPPRRARARRAPVAGRRTRRAAPAAAGRARSHPRARARRAPPRSRPRAPRRAARRGRPAPRAAAPTTPPVGGSRSSASSSSSSLVGPPLGGRVDRRLGQLGERALGVGREGADRLDLVAEEVDAQRLASRAREHVDSPPRTANWPRSSTRSTRS